MAETESEKRTKDTLCRLEHDGLIRLGQQIDSGGRNYSARAPLDYLIMDMDGEYHAIEVKEVGKTTIAYGKFKPQQRELLNAGRNTYALIRFYDGDRNRNHSCYWEDWLLIDGCLVPEQGEHGSLSLTELLEDVEHSQLRYHIAGYDRGRPWGFADDAGRTTRGNDSVGLTTLPFIEEGK